MLWISIPSVFMLRWTMTWSSNDFILNPQKSVTTTGMEVKKGDPFQPSIILFLRKQKRLGFPANMTELMELWSEQEIKIKKV